MKYKPHDAPAPITFGLTPWYRPRTPFSLYMVINALKIPLYFGLAAATAETPSFTASVNIYSMRYIT